MEWPDLFIYFIISVVHEVQKKTEGQNISKYTDNG